MTTIEMKACGCLAHGLTRNVTLWECAECGYVQSARKRRCGGCDRSKPAPPKGFGCCGEDWPAHREACGTCGKLADEDEMYPLPHPEQTYLTETVARGTFEDRRGVRRCVGCLAVEGES